MAAVKVGMSILSRKRWDLNLIEGSSSPDGPASLKKAATTAITGAKGRVLGENREGRNRRFRKNNLTAPWSRLSYSRAKRTDAVGYG